MVSLKIKYDTDLGAHYSAIRVNETLYINKAGAFKDEIPISCKLEESLTLNIQNYLLVENGSITKNPFKIIASFIVMFFIAGNAVSIYDFDCWDYETEFILKVKNITPSVMIKVFEHEARGKSTFNVEGNGCEVVSKKTKAEINKDYINIRFEEYFRFNFLRTIFFSAILITISIIGIIAKQITTILFPVCLVVLITLAYFYSKKQLKRMKKQYLEM